MNACYSKGHTLCGLGRGRSSASATQRGSDGADGKADDVVDQVCRDRPRKPVVEEHPEEEHASEPRVHVAQKPLVLVPISEEGVSREHGRADRPGRGREQADVQASEGGPVGQRPEQVQVEPLGDAEPEEAEEQKVHHLRADDGAQEDEPPEANLLHEAGPGADDQAPEEDLERVELCGGEDPIEDVGVRSLNGRFHLHGGREEDAPQEDGRAGAQPVAERRLGVPERERLERDGARPEHVDDPDPERAHQGRDDVVPTGLVVFFALFAHVSLRCWCVECSLY